MKKLSILLNIFFGIILVILIIQLLNKNEILNEMKSESLRYQEEELLKINKQLETNNKLSQELEQMMEIKQKLELENKELIEEVEYLTIIDVSSIHGLKNQGVNDYNIITEDLYSHPELIPFDGILGGTMQFFNVYILNDKWVYARFEDGHIQGYGLYEFSLDDNLNISWKVIDAILDE